MNSAKRAGLYLSALAILLVTGVVNGKLSGRWSGSADLASKAARLERLPMTVGAWKARSHPLDQRIREQAGITGYLSRSYEDGRGGVVTVLLVCGRPGPISAHTPEVCFPGNGYEPAAPRVKVAVGAGSPPDQFWASEFNNRGSVLDKRIRVLYGWSTDGSWGATETPRFGFAGTETLFKLYVIRASGKGDGPGRADPAVGFLNEFLPELRARVFSARRPTTRRAGGGGVS